jgi:dipeptidyl aminopeptidase/acylaminoacyl peptidase
LATIFALAPLSKAQRFTSSDLTRFRFVGDAVLSPDSHRVAYTVILYDRPGRPSPQLWIMDLATHKSILIGGEKDVAGNPHWAPDGKWLAFQGSVGEKHGLLLARADGADISRLATMHGTNSPLPGKGHDFRWSPDSKQIAFVSSTPDERAAEANGDPMVITRYLYKPDAGEGMTRFNDNQRLHIFAVDVATKQVRHLTQGTYDEPSIDWSPDGKAILFASNRQIKTSSSTTTFSCWCDGQRRSPPDRNGIQRVRSALVAGRQAHRLSRDEAWLDRPRTTMEDTHVWMMNADGSDATSWRVIDRQGAQNGRGQRAGTFHGARERKQLSGGLARRRARIRGERRRCCWRLFRRQGRHDGYSFSSPRDMSELYVKTGSTAARKLTDLNAEILAGNKLPRLSLSPSSVTTTNSSRSVSHQASGNDRHLKHPLIVNIHGGPHGQNGPSFNFRNQIVCRPRLGGS